ncbi:DUF2550 family protein [Flaviflexus huanghaiensis]|uniref:DUF2550 family protein n=1 Tax=Flaviflexus huanghaiensis TaxID=1111473 RepID=UPI0015F82C1E|nr:DUF2550 family protein [Flaviflexus huanghaiensis]
MNTPAIVSGVLIVLLLIAGVFILWAVLRTRALYRRVGSFPCAVSVPNSETWRSGVAIFGAEYITWFRIASLSRKPAYSFSRHRLRVVDYHQRDEVEGTIVVHLECNGEELLWAMSMSSMAGLVGWMDGARPSEEPTGM